MNAPQPRGLRGGIQLGNTETPLPPPQPPSAWHRPSRQPRAPIGRGRLPSSSYWLLREAGSSRRPLNRRWRGGWWWCGEGGGGSPVSGAWGSPPRVGRRVRGATASSCRCRLAKRIPLVAWDLRSTFCAFPSVFSRHFLLISSWALGRSGGSFTAGVRAVIGHRKGET